MIELVDVTPLNSLITEANIGVRYADKGLISFSFNDANANQLDQLVAITFKAKQSGNVLEAIGLTSQIMNAEAYDIEGNIMDIELKASNRSNQFALYQNNPNPFTATTDISFELPTSTNVTFTIFDVTGKVIRLIQADYPAGINTITLDKAQLKTTGILYYQMEAGEFTATKKMVIID
jgi:hypothetical protein